MAGARQLIEAVSVWGLVFLLLRLASGRGEEAGEERCAEMVTSWSDSQIRSLSSLSPNSAFDRLKLRDLLFFLHIPRTGGRTFHQCFLKHLFASDERCPRSYDKLRVNRSQPDCGLISTHDDYSLLEKLSHEMASVVTTVRQPVDRVLSSYEFSIEVAARSLRPLRKTPLPKSLDTPKAKASKFMSTLDIWPWKYLVPAMQEDLFARRNARLGSIPNKKYAFKKNLSELSVNNSYDAAALAMPFHEFIHHPLACELVHNGATFQVTGLTNTSYLDDAGVIRTCVVTFPHLGKHVVDVAKKRLDRMLYVGLTDRQNESALFFAKVVGRQVSMELFLRSMMSQKRLRSPGSLQVPRVPKVPQNFTSLDEFEEKDVIEELLASYRECVGDLRKVQENRRSMSLDTVSPIKFSRERRGFIQGYVMEEVARLNALDDELYTHAQTIFAQQQAILQRGDFHFKQVTEPETLSGNSYREDSSGKNEHEYEWVILQAISFMVFSIPFITLVALAAVIYLVSKRQSARVKEI